MSNLLLIAIECYVYVSKAVTCGKTTKHAGVLYRIWSSYNHYFWNFVLTVPPPLSLPSFNHTSFQVSHHCARSTCLSCNSPPSYIMSDLLDQIGMNTRVTAPSSSPPEVSVNENGASSPSMLSPTILFETCSPHMSRTHWSHLKLHQGHMY